MNPVETLANTLSAAGLEHAFGVTGSGSSWDLITELERRNVLYTPVAHEAAGAIMAGTVSRITGRVAASLSIKGPGLANMLPGIAYNALENNPALSISECFPENAPPWKRHKRLDHSALLRTLVKGIASPGDGDTAAERLIALSRQEIPGPVHFELAVRKGWTADGAPEGRPRPDDAGAVRRIRDRLAGSARPVVIVGSLAGRRHLGAALDRLRIPVFTTAAGKGIVDERGACSAGVYTGDGKELAPETPVLSRADLVVGLGLRPSELLNPKPFGCPALLLDEVEAEGADVFGGERILVEAQGPAYGDILSELGTREWGADLVRSSGAQLRDSLLDGTWLPAACFETLNEWARPHCLVVDVGSFCTIAEHLWTGRQGSRYLGTGSGRFMGTALPSALGAALCCRDVPVVCASGDGGLRGYLAEARLAVERGLNLCCVLMSDGRYGSIAASRNGAALSRTAVDIASASWLKVFEAMGWPSAAVNSRDDFDRAVRRWDGRGPLFIETRFDPDAYGAMTRRLR